MISKLGYRIEEILLCFLIALDISGFLGVLPTDLGYIDKILSWVVLGYLVYKVQPTKILFGQENKDTDFLVVVSYFLLISKNLVFYSLKALEEQVSTSFLTDFFKLIVANSALFQFSTFAFGVIMLLGVMLYLSLKEGIHSPSILSMFFAEEDMGFFQGLKKFALGFFALSAFFIIVFNLLMEWLSIVIDDAATVMYLLLLFLILLKHKEKFSVDSFIFRMGSGVEAFYEKIIDMLYYKHKLFLIISGFLVLHLLTDIATFLIPYATGLEPAYFIELGEGHSAIPSLITGVADGIIYYLTVLAMLFLMLGPVVVWLIMYVERTVSIPRSVLALVFSSFTAFLLAPVFKITRMTEKSIVGVDIITRNVSEVALLPLDYILYASAGVFVVVLLLCLKDRIRHFLYNLAIAIVLLFFAVYLFYFFLDTAAYYLEAIFGFVKNYNILFAFMFLVFLLATVFFYIAGYVMYAYGLIRHWKEY